VSKSRSTKISSFEQEEEQKKALEELKIIEAQEPKTDEVMSPMNMSGNLQKQFQEATRN
jgi:hypothetical protein